MSERICLSAFTHYKVSYPSYVNLSLDGDDVVVTVREDAKFDEEKGYPVCGITTYMSLPKDEAINILSEALNKLQGLSVSG